MQKECEATRRLLEGEMTEASSTLTRDVRPPPKCSDGLVACIKAIRELNDPGQEALDELLRLGTPFTTTVDGAIFQDRKG